MVFSVNVLVVGNASAGNGLGHRQTLIEIDHDANVQAGERPTFTLTARKPIARTSSASEAAAFTPMLRKLANAESVLARRRAALLVELQLPSRAHPTVPCRYPHRCADEPLRSEEPERPLKMLFQRQRRDAASDNQWLSARS